MSGQTTRTTDAGLWRRHALYLLTWADFDTAIRSLMRRIRARGEEVDCVLGIARGGLVPAVALANLLGVTAFHVIAVGRNVGNGRYLAKQPPEVLWHGDLAGLRDRRVLVVDDVAGSGETLRHVRELAVRAGASAVHTAVLVRMSGGASAVDHAAVELDDWVVFPWEDTTLPPGTRTKQVLVAQAGREEGS